ncbi:hypothetical protein CC78DRAFT_579579 [Lojkania enalia]|uniref:Uncharacterized protein n=1 Tax=Lojkania enalia TaxID=147567 RepID=A0A9P4KB09_9PLEO|nr:hypothetical protein CC78DRAFT_579579 [Didymosphaeria enalia]
MDRGRSRDEPEPGPNAMWRSNRIQAGSLLDLITGNFHGGRLCRLAELHAKFLEQNNTSSPASPQDAACPLELDSIPAIGFGLKPSKFKTFPCTKLSIQRQLLQAWNHHFYQTALPSERRSTLDWIIRPSDKLGPYDVHHRSVVIRRRPLVGAGDRFFSYL